MSTTLFQEVQSLNQNYSENAESIEEAKREALKAGRETACEEALAELTKGVEDCIKTAAKGGRKVRGQFLPRTECCVYRWARDDAAKDGEDLRKNKFGDYYLTDLLRRQGLIHRLQDWFDENHQCVPEVTEEGTTVEGTVVAAGAEGTAGAEGKDKAGEQEEGDEGDEGNEGDTSHRRGPRPTPPTRAFKVYWNPMRNKEGHFGIFVNWDREDWERVEKRLRSGSGKPSNKKPAGKKQRERDVVHQQQRQPPRQRQPRAPRFDTRQPRQYQDAQQQQQRAGSSNVGGGQKLLSTMKQLHQQQPQKPRNVLPPPRRPNNSNNSYAEQNTNSDGVAHSFHPSV